MPASKKKSKRFPGRFVVAWGLEVAGELSMKGEGTLLTVHADEKLPFLEPSAVVLGRSYAGQCLTLIDCMSAGSWTSYPDSTWSQARHQASYFPHYVALGDRHLEPNLSVIHAIHFTATDLETIFHDFDAFSHLINANGLIDAVLAERRQLRPVEAGPHPQIAYFTGKTNVADVETSLGRVSFNHRPLSNMGGPSGVYIKNRLYVSIRFSTPRTFEQAIRAMTDIAGFLSIAAGRNQGIKQIQIATEAESDGSVSLPLVVIPSFKWKAKTKEELFKPHAGDVPLDPIRRPGEFEAVLSAWVSRHEDWRTARNTNLRCLRKGNTYGPDRLIAASNMFDLLPDTAVPFASEPPEEMKAAKAECMAILRKLDQTVDRDSALDALGRIGRPTLTKKALHRVAIVSSKAGGRLPELELVVRLAIKCRNYLVHGSNITECTRLSPHFSFMTDALEFTFTVSDLVECGWSPLDWMSSGKGYGHSFSRFWVGYRGQLAELQTTLAELKAVNLC